MQQFKNKRILISGATGFIGRSLLSYLYHSNIEFKQLSILTRDKAKFVINNPKLSSLSYIDYIETDINHLVYNGATYDYILHAATSVVETVSSMDLVDTIINGTRRMLEFAVKARASVFINLSSGAVYGKPNTLVKIKEQSNNAPDTASLASSYGLAKLMAEHLVFIYTQLNNAMNATTLRLFAFGGKYLDTTHYALGSFINKALHNENIIVNAGKNIYRSYLDTRELSSWLLQILLRSETRTSSYALYNVGSDEPISIPALAQEVVNTLNSTSQIYYPNISNEDISYYVPNIDRIKTALGVTVQNSLREIITTIAASISRG